MIVFISKERIAVFEEKNGSSAKRGRIYTLCNCMLLSVQALKNNKRIPLLYCV